MISVEKKTDCCGCNACGDVCPSGAIRFLPDEEGFLYPQVDAAKCIQCGLCEKVCPQLHAKEMGAAVSDKTPQCWAAVAKDLADRFDSTSGGVFTTLAEKVLSEGGFVGGAVWGDEFSIHQIVSDNPEDLPRLRSSKYAQSDARGFYNAVKKAVATGRKVFVCGTPCQMMALKLVLGDKDNLCIADFICRGANSPMAMRRYVELFEAKTGKKVVAVKQKSKELGWRSLATKFTFEDGSVEYNPHSESAFMQAYLNVNVSARPSCYECRCKGVSRVTDLTLADCWGVVNKLDEWKFDKDLGTSSVLCHTKKGVELFQSVSGKLECQPVSAEAIVAGSGTICKSLGRERVDRAEFYARLRADGLESAMSLAKKPPRFRTRVVRQVRRALRHARRLFREILQSPRSFWQKIRINGLSRVFSGRPCLTPVGDVLWQAERGSSLVVTGPSLFGTSVFRGSRLESRALLTPGSQLILHGCRFSYGCNIQLFNGGKMEVGKGFFCNIGATFICSGSIKIGNGVICGRNVTIREYHGDHFINSPGYKCSKPIEIGDHVWLCEHSTIMPGVKVGSGSVVAAHSLVTHDVPPNCLVMGSPARVVRTGVQWKA